MLVIAALGTKPPRSLPTTDVTAPGPWAALPWVVIGALALAFELWQYTSLPRRLHPTLSSLLGDVTRYPVLRGLVFCCWLACGAWLALRGRAR